MYRFEQADVFLKTIDINLEKLSSLVLRCVCIDDIFSDVCDTKECCHQNKIVVIRRTKLFSSEQSATVYMC